MTADPGSKMRFKDGLFVPVLGSLMQSRWIIVVLVALTAVQLILSAAATIAWQCPLKSTLGVICPGCGLTRALVLLAKGHWKAAIDLHAFAPVFFSVGIFLAIGSILPAGPQQKIAVRIAAFERRTGFVALIIVRVLIYWILRITHVI